MPERQNADHHLSVLIEVVRQMSETFELVPLLKAAEQAGRSALGCERATIFLYDPQTDELHSKVATGTGEIRFPAKLGIAGEVVRTQTVVVVHDAYADSRFNPEIDRKTGFRTRNMLTLPLVGPEGEVIGALQLLNKVQGRFDGRDENLAAGLGSLIGMAVKRQILLDTAAAKELLDHDLNVARQIQMEMLPKQKPVVKGFDVAGWNRPADQTGGDCYGFQPLDGGRLLFLIADASGHGIGPALVVTQCRAMIRALADRADDPAAIAVRLNSLLYEDLPAGRFVTACFGILDPELYRVTYISAGHGPLLLYHAATGDVESFGATGLPMAILQDSDYRQGPPVEFQPGDIFCLLTDGFVEWSRRDGELYGAERLNRLLAEYHREPCEAIIQAIHDDVRRFSEGTPQADDLTAVIIKRSDE